MLNADKIYKSYGPQDVIKDITLQVGATTEREAGDLNVVELHILQKLQLNRQGVAIPTGKFGELVVGNDICPSIGLGHVSQDNNRNRRKTQQFGGS